MSSDLIELLVAFVAARIRFLIIGGHAVIHYGEPRYTKDVDIWIEASKINGAKVYKVLKVFGAPLQNLSVKDFSEPGSFFTMGNPPTRVDIIMSLKGLNFKSAWKKKVPGKVYGVVVPVIDVQSLIVSKLSAGRPQDLMDAGILQRKLLLKL